MRGCEDTIRIMGFLSIEITDEGKHWRKEIRLFGLLIYSRHDYAEEIVKRPIGFTSYPYSPIEIEDYDE